MVIGFIVIKNLIAQMMMEKMHVLTVFPEFITGESPMKKLHGFMS
jgi:hypothetical protein